MIKDLKCLSPTLEISGNLGCVRHPSEPNSHGLQPSSNGLQPVQETTKTSTGLGDKLGPLGVDAPSD